MPQRTSLFPGRSLLPWEGRLSSELRASNFGELGISGDLQQGRCWSPELLTFRAEEYHISLERGRVWEGGTATWRSVSGNAGRSAAKQLMAFSSVGVFSCTVEGV